MLGDVLELDEKCPEIYSPCVMGNFAVELSNNPFSRTQRDRVTEMTLNKDQKTPGWTTGFSLNPGAVKR